MNISFVSSFLFRRVFFWPNSCDPNRIIYIQFYVNVCHHLAYLTFLAGVHTSVSPGTTSSRMSLFLAIYCKYVIDVALRDDVVGLCQEFSATVVQ